MPTTETIAITLANGQTDRFEVTDGNAALYAASIERGGYGRRTAPDGAMDWYSPEDITEVVVT